MSNDHTFTIKVTVDVDSAEALERKLSEALGDDPYERQIVLTYDHFRNLGPSCAGRYDKTVEEILQEIAAEFPGAEIDMSWENEFGQEGGDFFHVEGDEEDNRETPEIIDREVAERFLEDPDSYDLSKASDLTDDAAVILAMRRDFLSLDGLTLLSDACAESLAKQKGGLSLDGLTELSDPAAEAFGRHGGNLSLDGLTEISDAAAEALAKHGGVRKPGGSLSLSGLTELSDAAAEALGKHGGSLDLNGLAKLSDASAESLAKHEAGLYLNGLAELSDACAESLAKQKGGLSLDGLTELSGACAESLAKQKGGLSLDGLTELSDAVAEALGKHKGFLSLNGLTELSDAAAEVLASHDGELCLMNLAEIHSPSLAATLARHSEDLDLEGLTRLSVEVAVELSRQKCESERYEPCLRMDGLTELSQETLKALMKHSGNLSLGLKSVSIDEAIVLAEFSGASLGLNQVSEISDRAAEILSRSKASEIDLEGLEALSPEAAKHLLNHECVVTPFDLEEIANGDDDWDDGEEWED